MTLKWKCVADSRGRLIGTIFLWKCDGCGSGLATMEFGIPRGWQVSTHDPGAPGRGLTVCPYCTLPAQRAPEVIPEKQGGGFFMKRPPLHRGTDEAGRPVIGHPAEPVPRCDYCRGPYGSHKRECRMSTHDAGAPARGHSADRPKPGRGRE